MADFSDIAARLRIALSKTHNEFTPEVLELIAEREFTCPQCGAKPHHGCAWRRWLPLPKFTPHPARVALAQLKYL